MGRFTFKKEISFRVSRNPYGVLTLLENQLPAIIAFNQNYAELKSRCNHPSQPKDRPVQIFRVRITTWWRFHKRIEIQRIV